MQILVFSIIIYMVIIAIIGLIGAIFDRELDRVFKEVKILNRDKDLKKAQKKEKLIKLFNQNHFKIDEPNPSEIIGLKRRFNVWWFLFWSSILLFVGSIFYMLYYFLVKTPDSIIVQLTEAKPKVSPIKQLEDLSKQYKKGEISRGDFEEAKNRILAENPNLV